MLQPYLAGCPASKHTKIAVNHLLYHAVVGPALLFYTPVTILLEPGTHQKVTSLE